MDEPNVVHPEVAGAAYLELIRQQLDQEVHRKDSLEQRGMGIVAASAALVTVVLGLATIATSVGGVSLTTALRVTLLGSLAGFVIAGGFGIAANWLRGYDEVKVSELRRVLAEDYWKGPHVIGTQRSGEVLVNLLESARKQNGAKARLLTWSMILEVLATGSLAASIALILFQS